MQNFYWFLIKQDSPTTHHLVDHHLAVPVGTFRAGPQDLVAHAHHATVDGAGHTLGRESWISPGIFGELVT